MTAPVPATEPAHPCLRCGTLVPQAISLCERCNPGRLAQPAASQAHGTVFLGIGIAVIVLAVVAQFLVGGVGPFTGQLTGAVPEGDGLRLSLEIRNAGSRDGRATCRVWDPEVLGVNPVETTILTPDVPAGREIVFQQRVAALGTAVRQLAVECSR